MTAVWKKTTALTLEAAPFAIRAERASDVAAREALLDASFGEGRHARTCQRLRDGRAPAEGLAFTAVHEGRVVGTVRLWHVSAGGIPALVLGPLAVDAVADWKTDHAVPLEPAEHGRVTVSREIGGKSLQCKEIVFSVDDEAKASAFYIAAICRDGQTWKWASAEPATERWGALQ